ncbi:selenide, water dikinase SelD [bacterium]|nr:selenide, water dikinase SelD [bacterium]
MGPCDLAEMMAQLPVMTHNDLLVGPLHGSDAGVFRLRDDLAIVQSTDFFPPMISDARNFGRIAAANAISDIYAMGATPVTALNLLAAPKDEDQSALVDMMDGAREIVEQAGAVISGGHTILNNVVMFGLSVTGTVHPDRLLRNTTVEEGDVLVLTKPIGTAVVVHAYNAGNATEEDMAGCISVMTTLNRIASEQLHACGAHASTDITGFGLLGHASDMLSTTELGIEIDAAAIPLIGRTKQLAAEGNICGGTSRNAEFTDAFVEYEAGSEHWRMILNDAQTSGGLLVSIPPTQADVYIRRMRDAGYNLEIAEIGRVVAGRPRRIKVRG